MEVGEEDRGVDLRRRARVVKRAARRRAVRRRAWRVLAGRVVRGGAVETVKAVVVGEGRWMVRKGRVDGIVGRKGVAGRRDCRCEVLMSRDGEALRSGA